MDLIPSREAGSRSAIQEFLYILCNPEMHCHNIPLRSILSEFNQIHNNP
jgi:hypothetical protein